MQSKAFTVPLDVCVIHEVLEKIMSTIGVRMDSDSIFTFKIILGFRDPIKEFFLFIVIMKQTPFLEKLRTLLLENPFNFSYITTIILCKNVHFLHSKAYFFLIASSS